MIKCTVKYSIGPDVDEQELKQFRSKTEVLNFTNFYQQKNKGRKKFFYYYCLASFIPTDSSH